MHVVVQKDDHYTRTTVGQDVYPSEAIRVVLRAASLGPLPGLVVTVGCLGPRFLREDKRWKRLGPDPVKPFFLPLPGDLVEMTDGPENGIVMVVDTSARCGDMWALSGFDVNTSRFIHVIRGGGSCVRMIACHLCGTGLLG